MAKKEKMAELPVSTSVDVKEETGSAAVVSEEVALAAGVTWKTFPKGTLFQNLAWSNSGAHAKSDTSWANVVELDGFDASSQQVQTYKSKGKAVIGYLSVGTVEDWRKDANSFPKEIIGGDLDDWEGEKWLKMSKWTLLKPVMTARLQMLKQKGFDAFEGDNSDVYSKEKISNNKANGLAYALWLADTAHGLGLGAVFKNSLDLVPAVVDKYDAIINEECQAYNECKALQPFIDKGKAVWEMEYKGGNTICGKKLAGISTLLFDDRRKGWVRCPF